jgi:hypothetical protein
MRVPRTKSFCISFLIFAVIGLIVHEAMGPNICAHYGHIGVATIIAAALLVLTLVLTKRDERSGTSARSVLSYILVIAVSAGIWYEIWSIQACNAETRENMVHESN